IESVGDISEDLKIDLYESVTEKIQYKHRCLDTFVAGRMLLFFPEEQSLNNLDYHLQKILNKLNPYSFILGKGGIYPLSRLHTSFSEAFKPFATAEKKEKSYSAERERLQLICNSMLKADNSGTRNMFEDYWVEIFNSFSFSVALGKMVALFTTLLDKLDTHLLTALDFTIYPAEEIMSLNSVEEWQQWSSNIVRRLNEVNKVSDQQSYPRPLIAALAYIRENYQKPLQLSLVADEYGITGSYLSRLFKEHLGTNFIDYLNQLRLKKAITLLESKKYPIKEIAYIVGYQDPNYFSRIFRRHMGISPSDLEKRGVNNDK
ncbi:MAG: helix-turn-helix domain-containing protein, partial [Spirochaetales bacterium]|nr:helix-turn-helix domain-containing protein [Spirochaetales bacterium]